ncbi:MAG: DUF1015 domain-containing protein, partial [Oligoflexia bacterium]|nr:DUF1015 domain-containing protein [Oligoflexia bacterium]
MRTPLLRPFRALRTPSERAAAVSSVPYDVVSREEAAALAHGNPWSFLQVSRAEIGLPANTDPYSPAVYAAARANFERLIRECPLLTEDEPSLYLYRLRQGGHEQTGIAGAFSLEAYDSNRIKRHEKTRKDKEDDRTRHVLELRCQTGPVFLAHRGSDRIRELSLATRREAPLIDFTAPDGVSHTLWRVTDAEAMAKAFEELPALYIADGHHRAASARRARDELRSRNPAPTGREDYNFFLAVAFPSEELRILPYHRVLKTLGGRTEAELLAALGRDFAV